MNFTKLKPKPVLDINLLVNQKPTQQNLRRKLSLNQNHVCLDYFANAKEYGIFIWIGGKSNVPEKLGSENCWKYFNGMITHKCSYYKWFEYHHFRKLYDLKSLSYTQHLPISIFARHYPWICFHHARNGPEFLLKIKQ